MYACGLLSRPFSVVNVFNYYCCNVAYEMVQFLLWDRSCVYVTVNGLQDLIKCTPTSHADYDILQNTLSSAQYFIENFDGSSYREHVCVCMCVGVY